jgi:hypothetical protein
MMIGVDLITKLGVSAAWREKEKQKFHHEGEDLGLHGSAERCLLLEEKMDSMWES